MPGPRPLPIVRDEFQIGYTAQHEWAWLIAAAFFLGKVGAGLFLLSYLTDFELGALVGLLVVGVGKTTAHLLFLGRPERFLRAVVHWRTSRLSQGLIAMGVFLAFGIVYVVPGTGTAGEVFGGVALAAAIVLMIYDGFVLTASRGIALWRSWLLPALALFYSLLGGTTVTLVLRAIKNSSATETELEWMQISLLALNLGLVVLYLFTVQVRSAAGRLAVRVLTHGPLGLAFLIGAVGVGLVGTFALAWVVIATDSVAALSIVAVMDLAGHFLIFFAILRAGVYAPLRSPRLRPASAAGGA